MSFQMSVRTQMPTTIRETIIRNAGKCKQCGDEIESKHRHDYVTCKCGEISVDGGRSYLKRSARNFENFIDISEVINEEIEV